MNLLVCASLLLLSPQQAPESKPSEAKTESATGEVAAEGEGEEGEEVEEVEPEEVAVELVPANMNSAPQKSDDAPPFIEDVAVAAVNPEIQAMVTVLISDDKGIAGATIFYRRVEESTFSSLPLVAGSSTLFVARLPDGLQLGSFEYYIEAKDTGGNVARVGSADEPFLVKTAQEGTLERLEREGKNVSGPKIHPAWVMISLGTGVLASAGSAAFFYDFTRLQREIDDIDAKIADGEGSPQLTAGKAEREDSASTNLIFGTILGVVGVAALATGISLLVVNASE